MCWSVVDILVIFNKALRLEYEYFSIFYICFKVIGTRAGRRWVKRVWVLVFTRVFLDSYPFSIRLLEE